MSSITESRKPSPELPSKLQTQGPLMIPKRYLSFLLFLASLPAASGISVAQKSMAEEALPEHVLTACVWKFGGFSRIVAEPSACLARYENVVQWNSQGPAGPAGSTGPTGATGAPGETGATGPAGVAATVVSHTVFVPANGTPLANSQAFAAAIVLIRDASVTNRYLVQLDAGTYAFPASSDPAIATGIRLPSFVSVRGAGMNTTFVTAAQGNAFSYNSLPEGSGAPTVASLADFSASASGGYAISIEGLGALSVDHVQTSGYTDFVSAVVGARILVTNSIFNGPTAVRADLGHATIIGTQVMSFYEKVFTPGVLACFSVYDATLQPYPATCNPVTP